ncbi:MAG: hypothetical protein Q4F74_06300 [Synergistaceae bacterium]|nr:hypothetical protein [Synergistaceae bacterium]
MTISAGIEVCRHKYPIYKAAENAASLEARSKKEEGKDAVTLFTDSGEHTYKWDVFENGVMPKFCLLNSFLGSTDQERGKAFLYRMLELLRGADDKINIARCAYMLTRLEPREAGGAKDAYRDFSHKIFGMVTDKKERGELITAIYIYTYLTRKRSDD